MRRGGQRVHKGIIISGASLRSRDWRIDQAGKRQLRSIWLSIRLFVAPIGLLLAVFAFFAVQAGVFAFTSTNGGPARVHESALALSGSFAAFKREWVLDKVTAWLENARTVK